MTLSKTLAFPLLVLVLAIAGLSWFIFGQSSVLVPVAPEDTITSWSYEGFLNDDGPREAEARAKIQNWESKLGGADDYQLYVSIAQVYDHLGEGEEAYKALSKAIVADKEGTTGTAWHNLGVLFEKVGAFHSARAAHERAVSLQPGLAPFHLSRVELMVYRFPLDTEGVEAAFTAAEEKLGANDPSLIDLRKRWKASLQ